MRVAVLEGSGERVLMEGKLTHKIHTENSLWSLEPGKCVLVSGHLRVAWQWVAQWADCSGHFALCCKCASVALPSGASGPWVMVVPESLLSSYQKQGKPMEKYMFPDTGMGSTVHSPWTRGPARPARTHHGEQMVATQADSCQAARSQLAGKPVTALGPVRTLSLVHSPVDAAVEDFLRNDRGRQGLNTSPPPPSGLWAFNPWCGSRAEGAKKF